MQQDSVKNDSDSRNCRSHSQCEKWLYLLIDTYSHIEIYGRLGDWGWLKNKLITHTKGDKIVHRFYDIDTVLPHWCPTI